MKVLGIDEAGRGCVIGPLVMCGVVITGEDLSSLLDLGVRDSKKLSRERRKGLYPRIIDTASAHSLRAIEPARVDEASLNFLEAEEIAVLIREFSPQKVFFDVPTHPAGISNFVKSVQARLEGKTCAKEKSAEEKGPNSPEPAEEKSQALGTSLEPDSGESACSFPSGLGELARVELVGENKADEKFPIVSAASILAKVERDRVVAELRREYGDFGSGYPSDPKTQKFLREWFGEHGDFPPMVRRKWSTVRRLVKGERALF